MSGWPFTVTSWAVPKSETDATYKPAYAIPLFIGLYITFQLMILVSRFNLPSIKEILLSLYFEFASPSEKTNIVSSALLFAALRFVVPPSETDWALL
ncbi:hypothetical protein [Streptococcus suis]|uniref:hypothetical protein n=1 Tax=Streptococcus suis TaxID=1307 RepID=UPI001C947D5A|nr:hypothetical protein [Streptococcus suis]MBY5009637.1 hypothetical protein [Streptococcus suis]